VSILEHPTIGKLIDFDQPVGLLLVALLHFVKDEEDPAGIVATLRDALPAGSHLVLSHATADFHSLGEVYKIYDRATATLNPRPRDQVLSLFDGFELLDPGLVQVPAWRPEGEGPTPEEISRVGFYGGVGRRN
jgi:S-adenosyl methyltransferase